MITDTDTMEEFDFEDVPEEVMEFIYSEEYTTKLDSLAQSLQLSDDQKTLLHGCIIGLLTETTSNTQSDELLKTILPSTNTLPQIRERIEKEFIIPAYMLTTKSLEDIQQREGLEEKLTSILNTDSSPSEITTMTPADVLARMGQTFNTPATLAPTKRTYTEVPSATTTSKPLTEALPIKHAVDPYRELPEEK